MSKPIAEAKFYAITAEAAVKTLQSDAGRGLSGSEAKKRLGVYGENRLQKGKKTSFAKKFMLQFGDFMVLILLIASAVSFAVSCMQGEANLADPLLILGIVIANAFAMTMPKISSGSARFASPCMHETANDTADAMSRMSTIKSPNCSINFFAKLVFFPFCSRFSP